MPTIVFIFYLLSTPSDRITCSMWLDTPPTSAEVVAACGQIDLGAHELRLTNIATGAVICSALEAGTIYTITEACKIQGRLDGYRLDFYRPDFEELLCSVETIYALPQDAEIGEQCGDDILNRYLAGSTTIQFIREMEIQPEKPPAPLCAPPALSPGLGLLKQPKNAAELASTEKYYLLAGKLLWYGYAKPTECEGLSGVNAQNGSATECGLRSAAEELYAWQNRLDDAIYSASLVYNVPPRLLKNLIAAETQFWPWTGESGEVGLIQITEQGADLVMRYTLEGYHQLSNAERQAARLGWLDALRCPYCDVEQAIAHAEQLMPQYAQALAAYYCQEGTWQAATIAWNEKHARILGG